MQGLEVLQPTSHHGGRASLRMGQRSQSQSQAMEKDYR